MSKYYCSGNNNVGYDLNKQSGKYGNIYKDIEIERLNIIKNQTDQLGTIDDYEPIKVLGEGAYGKVYLCKCKRTNVIVAVKKVPIKLKDKRLTNSIINECQILCSMKHPNIINLIRIVTSKEEKFIKNIIINKDELKTSDEYIQERLTTNENKDIEIEYDNDNYYYNRRYENKILDSRIQRGIPIKMEDNEPSIYIIMEYMESDILKFYTSISNYYIPISMIKYMMYEMLIGLYYINECKIIHLDIKPNNLLIDREANIRLADFGLSISTAIIGSKKNEITLDMCPVTSWYRPPELLAFNKTKTFVVSHKTDIWSMGCIFCELIQRKPLFTSSSENPQQILNLIFDMHNIENNNDHQQIFKTYNKYCKLEKDSNIILNNIKSHKFNPSVSRKLKNNIINNINQSYLADISYSCGKDIKNDGTEYSILLMDLLLKMLEIDPKKRISAKEALLHPFFFEDLYCTILLKKQFKKMMKHYVPLHINTSVQSYIGSKLVYRNSTTDPSNSITTPTSIHIDSPSLIQGNKYNQKMFYSNKNREIISINEDIHGGMEYILEKHIYPKSENISDYNNDDCNVLNSPPKKKQKKHL